jgi:N6-adenosine-specific RNA methylase IME4
VTRYGCIVADAPWPEYGGGGRGAQNHYGLMSVAEISRLMKREIDGKVANSAHLWLWVTDNYLDEGLYLMSAVLGFTYKRTFCWVKMADELYRGAAAYQSLAVAGSSLQIGLGQYARGAHEICLFGTSGTASVPPPENRPPSVIFAPRREHSRKPDECFNQWFEAVSPGPRLEMFCREARPGWDAFGNQVDKFPAQAAAGQGGM